MWRRLHRDGDVRRCVVTAATLAPCGTDAAYQRHIRSHETPCDACRCAHRERQYARGAKDRARRAKCPPECHIDREALRRGAVVRALMARAASAVLA